MARLTTYVGTAAAVPVLRKTMPDTAETFRLPGGPLIPASAVLLGLGLAASARSDNLIAAAIALAVGAVLFLLRRAPANR